VKKFLLALVACVYLFGGSAHAHVLIADDQRQMGAVLHITPDDDPIAGEPSTISIAIQQTGISEETHAYRLHISSDQGQEGDVPLQVAKGSVTASYVFPSRGVYRLIFTLEPLSGKGQTVTFRQAQRISRGDSAGTLQTATSLWARLALTGSVCGLLVIGFVVFNKRKILTAYAEDRKF
jgi:hypothetical protein